MSGDGPDYPVHPFAATFPMLSDDELMELARDITKHGLIHPVMLDSAGEQLLDGRNRRRACRIAGVEPRFDRLAEGIDPIDYIISVNVERRHLNVGQRAVVLALAHPEKRPGKRSTFSETEKVAPTRLSYAREIVAHVDLAKQVMSGVLAFDHALQEARWRNLGAREMAKHQRELAFEAPDLAEEVKNGELSLYQAMRQLAVRQTKASADRRKEREAWVSALQIVVAGWKNGMRADDTARALAAHALGFDPSRIKAALSGLDRLASGDATA